MYAIWALTAQAIMVMIAYTTAALAAGTFATFAITRVTFAQLQASWPAFVETVILITSTSITAFAAAFWPAAIAVAITEGLKLRGIAVYLAAGGLVGLVQALPLRAAFNGDAFPPITHEAVILCVACGAVGGLTYWAIAGRTAGRWLELPWFAEYPR
ncbi:hypothetical protein L1787_01780 [Acuticoccus sp. M5D2P5]|uniref:hypothetical protein n=1 Tax=Acuticoccus kalidii TaxID=2910977 RepID=UPI001F33AD8D|nr:hypothetical protein [Acuticoccus kalidii]MCF3932143.1 hypothetical protein [Acuticoccus kalidii]